MHNDPFTIFFTNQDTGYMAGYGFILQTTDAGLTWNVMDNHIVGNYYSAYFPDANNGYFCGDGGAIVKYSVNGSVGVRSNDPGFSQIKIYPNATNDKFTVELLDNHYHSELEIFDLQGTVLLRTHFIGHTVQIDASSFTSGIYFIHVKNKSLNETVKLIKN
jgi:hypothetical protein